MLQEISAFKPDFSIILGDFNASSKSWWNSDINTNEGTKIDAVTSSSYGLQQLISQPTPVNSGTHPSLHPSCHHQNVYCKLDLKIVYPPPY